MGLIIRRISMLANTRCADMSLWKGDSRWEEAPVPPGIRNIWQDARIRPHDYITSSKYSLSTFTYTLRFHGRSQPSLSVSLHNYLGFFMQLFVDIQWNSFSFLSLIFCLHFGMTLYFVGGLNKACKNLQIGQKITD